MEINPTNEYMVCIDFLYDIKMLLETQRRFKSFLGKEVFIHQTGTSNWLYWGEGQTLLPESDTNKACQNLNELQQLYESSCEGISWLKTDTILPNWLDRLIFDSLGARYEPDWEKFEYNLNLELDDLKVYLGTYFPRSYAEAFCILDALFANDAFYAKWEFKNETNILDIGCGTGGNLLGILTALVKHFPNLKAINIFGIDGNIFALDIAKSVIESFRTHFSLKINHDLSLFQFKIKDLPTPNPYLYDFITSFKMGGEIISACQGRCDNIYYELLTTYIHYLSDVGIFTLLDVTTKPRHSIFYPQLLNQQVSKFIQNHPDFATISPTPCHLYENDCRQNCFTQKEFSVSHRKARHDLSRVAYRIIGTNRLAGTLHYATERQAEYLVWSRRENKKLAACPYSSKLGIQKDGYLLS